MGVGIIIPARNEALALEKVLKAIPRDLVQQIIVVDNGSTDSTVEVAVAGGAKIIKEPKAGYGHACLAGIKALDDHIQSVVFLDGDYSDYPEELPKLLEPIQQGYADLVIGSRVLQAEPGSLTFVQKLGNYLSCKLIQALFGYHYSDLGPFRVIRRHTLDMLNMQDKTFGWTVEMQAKAAREQIRVIEVPVRYRKRIGQSKISGTVKGSIKAGYKILSTIAVIACGGLPVKSVTSKTEKPVLVKTHHE